MNFLTPAALLLTLLAVPILLLYMLKLRRHPVKVSSTLLWMRLMRDREANSPWQKLRRNLLLILQLLILAGLAFALARPYLPIPTVAAGSMVILLDASASMNATDVRPSRFAAAQAAARQLIEGLSNRARVSLIRAADPPQVLVSAEEDRDLVRRALESAAPGVGPADWFAAYTLAAAAVGGENADRSTVVVISDGGLPQEGLPPIPAEVRYVPIGASSDNLALSAFSLRPAPKGPELFASVANYGDLDRRVIVSFYAGAALFSAQEVSVPAGGSAPVVLSPLPEGQPYFRAELSPVTDAGPELDSLALDDVAFAVYQPPAAGRTLLVTEGNVFLDQILTALPGIQPFRAPASASLPTDPFDLYVFDGVLPDELPNQDMLLINPPSNPLFQVGGEIQETAPAQVIDSPLTRYVDWRDVHVLQAKQVLLPDWAEALVEAPGGPLVFAGEVGGRHVAVLTFDLHDSDLPLQVAYPILMSNLFSFLSPAQAFSAPDGLRPGETLDILPEANVDQLAIGYPDGSTGTFAVTESGLTFTDTRQLGLYAVNYLSAGQVQDADFFAVNLFEPAESDVQPRSTISVGQTSVTAARRQELGQREFWPWLAALALLILLVEWWVYHRGASLRWNARAGS